MSTSCTLTFVPGGTLKHTIPLPSAVVLEVTPPTVTLTEAPAIGMPSSSINRMALLCTAPHDTGPPSAGAAAAGVELGTGGELVPLWHMNQLCSRYPRTWSRYCRAFASSLSAPTFRSVIWGVFHIRDIQG